MNTNSPESERIVLKISHGNDCQVYTLHQPKYTIGRASTCDIQVKSHHLSRQQAIIFLSPETGQVTVADGNGQRPSSNGTYVNGSRIQQCQIQVGDIIHFGSKLVKANLDIISDLSLADLMVSEQSLLIDAELKAFDEFMEETSDSSPTAIDSFATAVAFPDSSLPENESRHTVVKIFYNNDCQVHTLRQPKYTIGRANTCDIQIKSYQVSRQQATLFFSAETGQVTIVDGNGKYPSSNGTYVNGSRIQECQIRVGDTIHFGSKLVKANLDIISDLKQQDPVDSQLKILDELMQEGAISSGTISSGTASSGTTISCPDSDLPEISPTSVEQLTLKISQLYYELDLASNQLKQKEHAYLELKKTFETYRHQVEQKRDYNPQDLTSITQEYEQQIQQKETLYRDLITTFDRYQIQVEQENNKKTQEIRDLTWKLTAANKSLQDYEKQYQTLIEDYKLCSQRVEQRLDIKYIQMQEDLILELLVVVDSFELAEKNSKPMTEEGKLIHQGYQGIYRLLLSVLDHLGVTRITTVNLPFDPLFHEAISYQISDQVPEDTILEENQAGYKIGSKVIRPAKVTVAGLR